jgi:hypothetical protein
LTARPAKFDFDVLPLNETAFLEAPTERFQQVRVIIQAPRSQESDGRQPRLLRARRNRPSRCAAEKRKEIAPPYAEHGLLRGKPESFRR